VVDPADGGGERDGLAVVEGVEVELTLPDTATDPPDRRALS